MTYFYKEIEEIAPIVARLKQFAHKGKIQTEICPTTGRPHLHAMIWCHKKHRDTEFKLPKEMHWEALKDEDNARDYCAKEETHDGIFREQWGFPKPIIVLSKTLFHTWQRQVLELLNAEPDPRKVHWIWESEGNVGKSALCKYLVVEQNVIFCQGGKHSDLMNLVFNSDMDKSNAVIFDIPRAHRGHISYSAIEAIKNGLVCNTKYETGFKAFNTPHLVVFANFPPDDPDQLSSDRWDIREIRNLEI